MLAAVASHAQQAGGPGFLLLGARIDKSRVWPVLIGGSLPLLAEQTHLLQKLAPVTWPSQMCKCYDQPRNAASRSLYHKTCAQVHAASKGSKAPGIVCRAAELLYQLTHQSRRLPTTFAMQRSLRGTLAAQPSSTCHGCGTSRHSDSLIQGLASPSLTWRKAWAQAMVCLSFTL